MYPDILNRLIFDAVYGSWILSLLLFTLGIKYYKNLVTKNAFNTILKVNLQTP